MGDIWEQITSSYKVSTDILCCLVIISVNVPAKLLGDFLPHPQEKWLEFSRSPKSLKKRWGVGREVTGTRRDYGSGSLPAH